MKSDFDIPHERLPPGFAETVERLPDNIPPTRPAATIVLLREGDDGLEVLLLERVRSAGFVPGAWVFPGGRVDGEDAEPELVERLDGLDPLTAAHRLGLQPDAEPPALAYYIAAIREAFEETGILIAADAAGAPPPTAVLDQRVQTLREAIMANEDLFPAVLDRLGCRMSGASLEYVAHWITPVAEPRRYDTRFFAARVPPGSEALPDPRECTRALWVRPAQALEMNLEGRLPMVFPTIHTLRALTELGSPEEALGAYRAREIRAILPRLVRTPTGVGIQVDPERS